METALLFSIIFRIFLGLILAFGGVMKLFDLKSFKFIVMQFGIIPRSLSKYFSYFLPFVEIIVGLALLFKFMFNFFIGLTLLMMTVYTIGSSLALYQKKKIDNCGCYGTKIKVPLTWRKIVENIAYVLMALYLILI